MASVLCPTCFRTVDYEYVSTNNTCPNCAVLDPALRIYKEAVQYFLEQKSSRGLAVLHAEDGDFVAALTDERLDAKTRSWLGGLRDALCRDLY